LLSIALLSYLCFNGDHLYLCCITAIQSMINISVSIARLRTTPDQRRSKQRTIPLPLAEFIRSSNRAVIIYEYKHYTHCGLNTIHCIHCKTECHQRTDDIGYCARERYRWCFQCFHFVCLSVNKILKKLQMNVHKFFWRVGFRSWDIAYTLKTPPISFPCTISNIICSLMTLILQCIVLSLQCV